MKVYTIQVSCLSCGTAEILPGSVSIVPPYFTFTHCRLVQQRHATSETLRVLAEAGCPIGSLADRIRFWRDVHTPADLFPEEAA